MQLVNSIAQTICSGMNLMRNVCEIFGFNCRRWYLGTVCDIVEIFSEILEKSFFPQEKHLRIRKLKLAQRNN